MLPLFEHYPRLADALPYVALGELPTPVQKLERLGQALGLDQLYVKRDDLTGTLYGGNKIRKLEFLMAHALRADAREVMTFGGAGSNHALATAVSARQLGLRSISMLTAQPNADYVRRNLLLSHHSGAELHHYPDQRRRALGTRYQSGRHRLLAGRWPYVIPPGGSSPRGVTGFVNAAFELQAQVEAGQLPEPDRIYVALGTAGTALGLKIGLKAAGLKSRVVPVRVVAADSMHEAKMVAFSREIVAFLRGLDPSFPAIEFTAADMGIVGGFLGEGYARFTREGMDAIARMEASEGLTLDGTYTGKTLAALVHDAEAGEEAIRDQVILFWNTLNSRDFSDAIAGVDYHDLPPAFHRYFEEPLPKTARID